MSLVLEESEIAVLAAQQAVLLDVRLDEARVRGVLQALIELTGAQRGFAAYTIGFGMAYISERVGPQVAAYLKETFRGFDRDGNVLLADPELEEINRRRRQMGAGVHHEARLQLREKVEASRYFREAFAPAGMHHVTGLTAPLPLGEAVFAFGFAGDDDPGFSGSRAIDLLRLMLPAFRVGFEGTFARAAARAELDEALAAVPGAQILTEPPGDAMDGIVLPGPALPSQAQSWIALGAQRGAGPDQRRAAAERYGLTRRQIEVMELMLEGLSAAEIARRLAISHHTARRHGEAVLSRLGVRSRAAIWSALTRSPAE